MPADRVAAQAWSARAGRHDRDARRHARASRSTITVTGPGAGATAAAHLQLRTRPFAEATVVLTTGSGALADNMESCWPTARS